MSKKRASRTNIYFKIDEENRLIDFVRRYEELYDPRQRMRNMHVRKKIWTEIGVKLGRSDSDCAKKWKCIKQDYMNRLRDRMAYGRYDVSRLSFLDEFIKMTTRPYVWKKNPSSGTVTSAESKTTTEESNLLPKANDNNIIIENDNDINVGQYKGDNNEIKVDLTNDFIIKESVDGEITLDLIAADSFGDDSDSPFKDATNANNDSTQKNTTSNIIPKDDVHWPERLNSKSPTTLSRPMIQFTNNEENRLIDLVKKNPQLYHIRHKTYPKQKKMEIWKKIGVKLGKTGRICMKKWLTIKQDYQRSLQEKTVNLSNNKYDKKRFSFLHKLTRVPLTFLNPDDRRPARQTNYFQQSNKKFGFFHDQLDICSASELELFFHWVYKSVGSLPFKEQARIRMEINRMVVNGCLRKK